MRNKTSETKHEKQNMRNKTGIEYEEEINTGGERRIDRIQL